MKYKVAFFDTHDYERPYFLKALENSKLQVNFLGVRLNEQTAPLAEGHSAVCCFVNDRVTSEVIERLAEFKVKVLALRCAGFNNVDLEKAKEHQISVVRVPEYSPYAVAEFALALILDLNRKIHRAYHRVRELNFTLDGLVGFDLYQKTVGIIGTGRIGSVMAQNMAGLGCHVLVYDREENPELLNEKNIEYVSLEELYQKSKIISLHVPLTPETHHIIDESAINQMQKEVMLINTGRGALVDTKALIAALKTGQVGAAGLDVYEEEENYFFKDLSSHIIDDDVLARLLTFPNVLLTSHQGFLTKEALQNIAQTTVENLKTFFTGTPQNMVK